jgi:hypothetical protein
MIVTYVFRSPPVTNSMEQCLWEANSHSASQEMPHILWKPRVHYHLSLSWARWIQSTPSYLTSLRLFTILTSPLYRNIPHGLFPSGFPTIILYVYVISHACYMPRPFAIDLIAPRPLGSFTIGLQYLIAFEQTSVVPSHLPNSGVQGFTLNQKPLTELHWVRNCANIIFRMRKENSCQKWTQDNLRYHKPQSFVCNREHIEHKQFIPFRKLCI